MYVDIRIMFRFIRFDVAVLLLIYINNVTFNIYHITYIVHNSHKQLVKAQSWIRLIFVENKFHDVVFVLLY